MNKILTKEYLALVAQKSGRSSIGSGANKVMAGIALTGALAMNSPDVSAAPKNDSLSNHNIEATYTPRVEDVSKMATFSTQQMQHSSSVEEIFDGCSIQTNMDIKEDHVDGKINHHSNTVREISSKDSEYSYIMRANTENDQCSSSYELRNNSTDEIIDISFLKDNINKRFDNALDSPENAQLVADGIKMMQEYGMSPEAISAASKFIDLGVRHSRADAHENITVNAQNNVEIKNTNAKSNIDMTQIIANNGYRNM